MVDKIKDKLICVRPLELLPVLAIVLGRENEDGAQKVFDVWGMYVAATDALQAGAIRFKLRSEEPRPNGTDADPAASSAYVEHAAEYFCVEVVRTEVGECTVNMFAGAEKCNEVYGRTEGGGEGELESDTFQNLCGESVEGGSTELHEEREGGEVGESEGWTDGASMGVIYGNNIQALNCFLLFAVDEPSAKLRSHKFLSRPFSLSAELLCYCTRLNVTYRSTCHLFSHLAHSLLVAATTPPPPHVCMYIAE